LLLEGKQGTISEALFILLSGSVRVRGSPGEKAFGPPISRTGSVHAPHLANEPAVFGQRWLSTTTDLAASSLAVVSQLSETTLVSAPICVSRAARLGAHRHRQDAAGRQRRAAPVQGVAQGRSAVLQPGAVLRQRVAAVLRLN
jgi:hypothetical protein